VISEDQAQLDQENHHDQEDDEEEEHFGITPAMNG